MWYIYTMNRYHKQIGFRQADQEQLKALCEAFNSKKGFGKTDHALDRLKEKFNFIEVLQFLGGRVGFDYNDVFEYYEENGSIRKVVFRMDFSKSQDIILVIARNKTLVTAFLNNKNDSHRTLDKSNYARV